MITQFPPPKGEETIKVRMDMTFDVPTEFAEQIELWGIGEAESCTYDQERRQIKISASTTLYRKGA